MDLIRPRLFVRYPKSSAQRPRVIWFWLGWLVVACLVPVTLLAGFLIADSYVRMRERTAHEAISTARALMQAVDANLRGSISALQVLALSPYLQSGDLAAFHRLASAALERLPGNGIVLADANLQQQMSTIVPFGRPLPRSGVPDLVRTVLKTGKPAISNFYIGATSKRPQVAVAVPVYRSGKPIYALAMGFVPEGLSGILDRQEIPVGWVVSILDSKGTVAARTRSPDKYVGHSVSEKLRTRISVATEGIYESTTLDAVPVIGGFSRSPVTGWTVAFGVPTYFYSAHTRYVLILDLAITSALLIGGVFFARVIAGRIARSIRALRKPALALGTAAPVEVPRSHIAEVDELGRAITRASELLDQRERERDEAKRERAKIEARLRKSQHLVELGQMAGSLAHDFGNLLTPILGSLQRLRKEVVPAQSEKRLDIALSAAERAAGLVQSLRAFASQQTLAVTTLDPNEVIRTMGPILTHSLGPSVKLIFNLQPAVWPIEADISQIERAMLNLVVNARDAMRTQGTVRVSTKNVALHGECEGLVGDFVAITVSDTGSGMTPEVLAHAFEPLFTTKGQKGTGLGLASIYGFAKQCGGAAAIDSEVGKGTAAIIYLPRALTDGGAGR